MQISISRFILCIRKCRWRALVSFTHACNPIKHASPHMSLHACVHVCMWAHLIVSLHVCGNEGRRGRQKVVSESSQVNVVTPHRQPFISTIYTANKEATSKKKKEKKTLNTHMQQCMQAATTRLGNGELEHRCAKVGLGHYKDSCRTHKRINGNKYVYVREYMGRHKCTKYVRLIKVATTRMSHLAYTPFSWEVTLYETLHSAPKSMHAM